jgi:hypothetical protein
LPWNASKADSDKYMLRLKETVFNKEAISLKSYPYNLKGFGPLPDGGPYDYILLTSSFLADYYSPLIQWRTRQGMKATTVTNEEIYSNYSGDSNQEKIRNFIIDAHQTWGTMYFLIGGEDSTIPFAFRNYLDEDVPSDAYYADYDDDWEYEVYVGRMTAEDSVEVERFINKILEYETNPPSMSFPYDITLLGMDLMIPENPPYQQFRGQWLTDSIEHYILPSSMNVTKVYDTDQGNHHDAFVAALNAGQNIINHSEHGGYSTLSTGLLNHGWVLHEYEVPNLTNYHQYSNIFAIGCQTNHMDGYYDVISEHFILDADSTGAVSWTGNTRTGWFYLSGFLKGVLGLCYYWNEGLFTQNLYRVGEPIAYAKSVSNAEAYCPYCEWTLNLLGDPAMPIWTDTPFELIVTHPTEVEAVPGEFAVHVELIEGLTVDDAYVCLWNGIQSYATGYTDINGNAVLDYYPTSGDPITVTVTKQNAIPYRGVSQVVGNIPPQCITPGDTIVFICTPGEITVPVGCFDPDGNLESGPILINGPGQIQNGYWTYSAAGNDSVLVTIGCIDSLGYSLEETMIVLIKINDPPQLTAPNDTCVFHDWPAPEIALPLIIYDENTSECIVIDGPGLIEDNLWKFTPENNIDCDIAIRTIDSCGLFDEDTFHFCCNLDNICGDVNGDDAVNLFDVIAMIQHIYMGGDPPDPYYVGNVDGTGAMSIFDITYLISYLYLNGPKPHCGLLD